MKAPARTGQLDRLERKLRIALRRETTNIIEIGNLLIESRKLLADEHGEWQGWLQDHFDLSYRTAVRYISAAEYVERKSKSDTVSLFANLSPTVLYRLAAGQYNEQEEAAILAATREGRVDQTRASAICEKFAPADDDNADDTDDGDDQDDTGKDAGDDGAEDSESAAIIDGPPPDVQPTENLPRTNFALRDFDQAINTLKRLLTKSSAQFASTAHTSSDLESIESFIHAVADRARKARPTEAA